MRDYRDAKAMAHTLRGALAERSTIISHSESLELIARVLGCASWHVLSAALQADPGETVPAAAAQVVRTAPLLPVRDAIAFPKQTLPLFLGRWSSKQALAQARKGDLEVVLALQRRREDDDPTPEGLWPVGVIADVLNRVVLPDGNVKMLVRGRERVSIQAVAETGGFRTARISVLADEGTDDPDAHALMSQAIALFQASLECGPDAPAEILGWLAEIEHPGALADLIGQFMPFEVAAKQRLLETRHLGRRLELALGLLQQRARAA